MKKFIALLLAAMMLMSCTVAMADNMSISQTITTTDDDGNEVEKNPTSHYHKEGKEEKDNPLVNTELWLQVTTNAITGEDGSVVVGGGQIDVTVPLVLLFKTSIDGGDAVTGTNYAITNNSTADLVVTDMMATIVKQNDTTNPMTMKAYTDSALARDEYSVQLLPKGELGKTIYDVTGTKPDTPDTNSVMAADKKTAGTFDMFVDNTGTALTRTYYGTAKNGGVFELKAADEADKDGKFVKATVVDAQMKTGDLSFVTAHNDDGTVADAYGLQLMTVTYTVAIDLSDAVGTDPTTGAFKAENKITTTDEDFGPGSN